MKIREYLSKKTYPGRILICGNTKIGTPAFIYVVMGRSEKSRNRVLRNDGDFLRTELYIDNGNGDNLILYSAKERVGDLLLLGNGEHIGYMQESLAKGNTLEEALIGINPEPDSPNYTPRIALVYNSSNKGYRMMISRYIDGSVDRTIWSYKEALGYGHVIHTYEDDSSPLVPFLSNPVLVELDGDVKDIANEVWESLDERNRVAMYYSDGNIDGIINQREIDNAKA